MSQNTETLNVAVEPFSGLLVDYAKRKKQVWLSAGCVLYQFEYEFQMAQMNRHLESELETIFLMPNEKYFYTSSSLIKQVHSLKSGNRACSSKCFRSPEESFPR